MRPRELAAIEELRRRPSVSGSAGSFSISFQARGREVADLRLVGDRQVAPLRDEPGAHERPLHLRRLHEHRPDKAGPRVFRLEQRDAEVDPDDVGIDPARLGVERIDKAVTAPDPVPVGGPHVAQGGHRLGRNEGDGSGRGAGRDRPVEGVGLGGPRRPAPDLVAPGRVRSRQSPQAVAPAGKFVSEVAAKTALRERGEDGVAEIVRVGVPQVAEVDVGMGELVDEELGALDEVETVIGSDRGAGPGVPIGRRQGSLDGAHAEEAQHHVLRVAVPAVPGESLFVVPGHGQRLAVVQEPLPVHVADQPVDDLRDLGVPEVFPGHDGAGKEKAGVDRRHLALPGALAGVHFHEMVEEAVAPGGFFGQEFEREAHPIDGGPAIRPAPLRRHGPGAQGEAGRGDAGLSGALRAVRAGPIPDQPGVRVRLFGEEAKGRTLQLVEERVVLRGKDGRGTRPRPKRRPCIRPSGARGPPRPRKSEPENVSQQAFAKLATKCSEHENQ